MKTVTVATFNKSFQTELLLKRLWEAGVRAEVHDESKLERMWFISRPLAGVRLEVHRDDYDKATRLLNEWDAAGAALREAIRCPECRSSRIEYPQFTRKFITPNLVGVLSALGFVEKDFYCQDCHFTWPPEGARPPRARPHMAPYYFIEGVEQTQLPNQEQAQARI